MSAAPAPAAPRQQHFPGGFTAVPNVVIQKIALMTPAEFYFAVIVAHRGDVSDTLWEEWTGKDVRTKQNAVRGLHAKELLATDEKGRFSLDVRRFNGWARHADPRDTRTAGRGPTKPATPKIHPDCAAGCAMSQGRAQLIPLDAPAGAKPVSSDVHSSFPGGDPNAAQKPKGSVRVDPPGAQFLQRKDADSGGWWKALAAMRKYFATAGTQLLMLVVAAVLALVDDATDYEIAEAVEIVVSERGKWMESPGLLVKAVPDVVLRERERRGGRRLFAPEEAKPVSPFGHPVVQVSQEEEDSMAAECARARLGVEIENELRRRAAGERDFRVLFARASFEWESPALVRVICKGAEPAFLRWVRRNVREIDSSVEVLFPGSQL